jgi:hypothetical protein
MIAGSKLSTIGSLNVGSRLACALAGATLALVAVGHMLWQFVHLAALPPRVSLDELDRRWDDKRQRPIVKALKQAHVFGYERPRDVQKQIAVALREFEEVRADSDRGRESEDSSVVFLAERKLKSALDQLENLVALRDEIQSYAQYIAMRSVFRRLLISAVVAAVGITLFVWAANPPPPASATVSLRGADMTGADLRDADLTAADLTGADFTGADLSGARMAGARLKDVVWARTTCPDGSSSDQHDTTCLGHLSP